jgi:hypothetical protein
MKVYRSAVTGEFVTKEFAEKFPDATVCEETCTIGPGDIDDAAAPFCVALRAVKKGAGIQREGWNGKGMWVFLQKPDAHSKMTLPYLYIEYEDGRRCPWLASQTDLMAEDWIVGWKPLRDPTKVADE